jgi:hypothetical protein
MTHTVAGVAHHVYIRDTPFTKGKTHTGAQMGKNGEKCTRKKKGKKKRAKRERAELARGSCHCAGSSRRADGERTTEEEEKGRCSAHTCHNKQDMHKPRVESPLPCSYDSICRGAVVVSAGCVWSVIVAPSAPASFVNGALRSCFFVFLLSLTRRCIGR